MRRLKALLLPFLLGGCLGIPEGITPVSDFNSERYLGTWYEIARLDHSFERGLTQVTATYSRRDDGGIKVINRGYNPQKQTWKEAEGRAYFVEDAQTAYLKVSFFGPFFGSYIVFDLDPGYSTAFVTSTSRDYVWLLARTPQVDAATRERFIERARQLGYAVDELIFVTQPQTSEP